MHPAAVGFQCPECISEGAKTTRSARTTYGGKPAENPQLTSIVLIAINALVWLLILGTGGRSSRWVDVLALAPDSFRFQDGTVVTGVDDGAYWQLLTSMFTHTDLLHIGFNMFALWLFGPQLEAVFGRARFLALYLLSGLAGSVAVYVLTGIPSQTLGASGAIFGLFAAYLLFALKMKANVTQLLVLLGINVFISFRGGISWQGHLGGFLGGAVIAAILMYAPRGPRRTLWQVLGLSLFGVLLFVGFVARTLAIT